MALPASASEPKKEVCVRRTPAFTVRTSNYPPRRLLIRPRPTLSYSMLLKCELIIIQYILKLWKDTCVHLVLSQQNLQRTGELRKFFFPLNFTFQRHQL